jgi:penicillin amidase
VRILRRLSLLLGVLLLIAVIAVAGWFYWMTRRPWPQTGGTVSVSGLNAPVEVLRDGWGVPHIYATNTHDLFFAQGYVHAQDRFYQMEFWRRIGQGRLSEMLGKSALEQDRFIRTLGWWQTAQQEAAGLTGGTKVALEAYAEGVNAYIDSHRDALAVEFAILRLIGTRVQIEPWTPAHSLVWGKVMAWDLGGNMAHEIQRARIVAALGQEAMADLTAPYPDDHPIIVPSSVRWDELPLDEVADGAELGLALGRGIGIGSNNWVIAGSHTESGKPLLANDMHLGIQMPAIWYEVGLHCQPFDPATCNFNVAGFSFAGTPGVIVGHNDDIGWGVTNLGPDVQDLYVEQLNPENANQYQVNGEWVDFEIRHEEIVVAGQAEPETLDVRVSRHGPVLNPVIDHLPATPSQVLALRWTALEPGHIFEAVLEIDQARNWDEFRQALRSWDFPSQNFVYADVEGNIGYQAPGRIPIRANGDGRMPVPGWTDEYEWTGYIPFDELPSRFNPPEGFIVTANNAVVDSSYPYLLTHDWDSGYRAQRITEMIQALDPVSVADVQAIHGDNKSLSSAEIIPYLLSLQPGDAGLRQALERLAAWDGQENKDSAEALLYEVFWARLPPAVWDEVPGDLQIKNGSYPMVLIRDLLAKPNDLWWDDKRTGAVETRDDLLLDVLQDSYTWLQARFGKDMSGWRWGALHTATFENQSLGQSGILPIEMIFNRGPVPASGGTSIVNATSWSTDKPAIVTSVPSERMILDLTDWQRSLSIQTTGQSGHPYHKHYGDMIVPWRDIQYHTMHWERVAIEPTAEGLLRLQP